MNILYTIHAYKPAYRFGGPVLIVSELAERLTRKGHKVVVFTSNANLDEDLDVPVDVPVNVDGVEVWYFRRKEFLKQWFPFIPYLAKSVGYIYAPRMAGELNRLLPQIDLVHTHLPFAYPSYAAARAAKHFGKPLFYHQQGVYDPERLKFRSLKKQLYIKLVELPIMRRATTLIACTEAEVRSFRALGLTTPCRIVPNGIDVDIYRQDPSPSADLWNISPQAQVVLFLGRLHPIKGADRLLEAFLQIYTRLPHAILVMAGPDEWGCEAKFRETVRQAGLQDRILFPGMVSGEAKLDLLARADLFCLPSDAEGFSMAVLEALASGTPVLISQGCHFPEVETGGVGLVVPPTPEAFAKGMVELLNQPERLGAMGTAAVGFVRDNYSWDLITDKLLDVYLEGMQRHSHFHESQAAISR